MSTLLRGTLRLLTRLGVKPLFAPAVPVRTQRRMLRFGDLLTRVPADIAPRAQALGGVPGEWLGAAAAPGDAVLLYLHGGGYCVGSLDSHRPITAHLARASGLPVYAADYRLAPEHPYPAALNDAVAVYRALLDAGHARILLAGDSAGGGLALATTLSLRDAGLPLPVALLLISPWTDLSCGGTTMDTHARQDPMLSRAILQRWGREYAGRMPVDHPLCSPLLGDLRRLPPVLIQVGCDEVLLDDSLRLEQGLLEAKVPVTLQAYPKLWHDFQLYAGLLPEADTAIARMAEYARKALEEQRPARGGARLRAV